ncbi:hypothetical protein AW15_17910 [Aeromonas sp. HZM]|uniref:hypothetical protein n=1 Tax=Aeromonas sp. HZM TaxID=1454008 RepID=UPI0004DB12C5|nr:hypothetical protein [Aeromonas sp. HZM]KDV01795.1 hypothetical protein AW15_17910 [Aeromonas sp. HZM]
MKKEIQVIVRRGRLVEFEDKIPRPEGTLVKDNVVFLGLWKCVVEYIDQDTIGLQIVNIK